MSAPLNTAIQRMLRDAYVSRQVLPQCPDIQLWLVDPAPMQRPFSQAEILAIQDYPAYWAFCWASGQVLAREILAHPEWVRGKKVMDFGAGSGVVAVACAMAGAKEVIACDIDPDAALACAANAELNGVHYHFHDDVFTFDEPLDLLIAADVLYDRANLPLLKVFRDKAAQVLVADSRIRDFHFPPYHASSQHDSCTIPDLDELDEFRRVQLYWAG